MTENELSSGGIDGAIDNWGPDGGVRHFDA